MPVVNSPSVLAPLGSTALRKSTYCWLVTSYLSMRLGLATLPQPVVGSARLFGFPTLVQLMDTARAGPAHAASAAKREAMSALILHWLAKAPLHLVATTAGRARSLKPIISNSPQVGLWQLR